MFRERLGGSGVRMRVCLCVCVYASVFCRPRVPESIMHAYTENVDVYTRTYINLNVHQKETLRIANALNLLFVSQQTYTVFE